MGEPIDRRLQKVAIGCLAGLDLSNVQTFSDIGATSAAFDARGRLLLGGVTDARDQRRTRNARLWDEKDLGPARELGTEGEGPVGFSQSGTPIQLVVDVKKGTLTLIDLERSTTLRGFDLRGRFDDVDGEIAIAMTPDGTLVAAGVRQADGSSVLLVWSTKDGKVLHRFPMRARSAAFAPDGSLLAAGDDGGHVRVWSLPDGADEARLTVGRAPVTTVEFGRNPRLSHASPQPLPARRRWQLAVALSGATISVWDVGEEPQIRSLCHGSSHQVYAIAFSPDGTLLATAGRSVHLWDAATGEMLLHIKDVGPFQTALAFSPDGTKLATGSNEAYGYAGSVRLVSLENGRGIGTLRGLTSPLEQPVFSPDGRWVAALSHGWQIGVWDAHTGGLKVVLDAPPGKFADNAGLAFSPDGRRLAFSSDREARMWDLETGQELENWTLPVGFQDRLVFPVADRLILARAETTDPAVAPYGGTDAIAHPRLCAVYNLLGRTPLTPIRRVTELPGGIGYVLISPDGRTVLLNGFRPLGAGVERIIAAYDVPTGDALWSIPSTLARGKGGFFRFLGSGEHAVVRTDDGPYSIFETRTGRLLRVLDSTRALPSPDESLDIGGPPGDSNQVQLYSRGSRTPLLDMGPEHLSAVGVFSPDGRVVASSAAPSTNLSILDIAEVRRRLNGVDLGW